MPQADDLYFGWLQDQSVPLDSVEKYGEVLKKLYSAPYVPHHELDVNRAEDGVALREEWAEEYGEYADDLTPVWMDEQCSVLEMLVGMSRRAEYNTIHVTATQWVSIFLMNLDVLIGDFDYKINEEYVEAVLEDFSTGDITIFPTNVRDGKSKELWYQMMDYIEEQHLDE